MAAAKRIESIRLQILQLFQASPKVFDVVFVANATAGIKLVADGFCASPHGFRYKYLRDVHTSLVGVCGLAQEHEFLSEEEVDAWLSVEHVETIEDFKPGLFAFPAQSNFNGRRFPLQWISKLKQNRPGWYSLLDAASFLTTTPLNLSDGKNAPDFTVMSFYKIFGYPDLGAIIVRRFAARMLIQRRYFGGGTRATLKVDSSNSPHTVLHESLEDGTLPFHSILALEACINNFKRLFGIQWQSRIAQHVSLLNQFAYSIISSLQYENGMPMCQLYSYAKQGPIITFNILSQLDGRQIGFIEFEKQASMRNFAVRTGGMCNPGSVQRYLDWRDDELDEIFEAGKECGDEMDLVGNKNLGAIRISFGACSTVEDVCAFVEFLCEFCLDRSSGPGLA